MVQVYASASYLTVCLAQFPAVPKSSIIKRMLNVWTCLIILTALAATVPPGNAAPKKSYVSLTAYTTQFLDLRSSSKTSSPAASLDLEPMTEVEVTVRLKAMFNLGFVGGFSTDNLRGQYGAGFRVDTPGFFFIGGNPSQDVRRRGKNYPVNTSVFSYLLAQTREDAITKRKTQASGSSLGLTMDVFLFNPRVYLSTQAAYYSWSGNAYLSYSSGLGIQF